MAPRLHSLSRSFEERTTEFLRTRLGATMSIATADEITFTIHLVTRCAEARALAADPRLTSEAEPGDVAVFSSLTPHRTGPNITDSVRKAYIVQYAPDGAEVIQPEADGSLRRIRQDDPDRQFLVAPHGRNQRRTGSVHPQLVTWRR